MTSLVPIFVTLFRNIVAHWKIEAFVLAIVTSISLLANSFTAPKLFAVVIIIGEWYDAISRQMIFSTAVAAVFSMGTWWLQKQVLQKRTLAAEAKALAAEKIATYEREEKESIARGHRELMSRVAENERTLNDFKEKIALMDQTVSPLLEATKLRFIEALTHPKSEFKIPDELLQSIIPPGSEMPDELTKLLKERETSTHPDVTPVEKLIAATLPQLVLIANEEAKTINAITSVQLVSSPIDARHAEEEDKNT